MAFNYDAARDDWMGGAYDVTNPELARQSAATWAAKHGIQYNGSDTINLPNGGGFIDILGNFAGGAGNGQPIARNWTPAGGNGPNPNGIGAGVGAGTTGAQAPAATTPQQNELYQLLLGRATQAQAVDRNDPTIRAQSDAFSANQERARRNFLGDLAEQSGPYNTGAMLGQQRMTAEKLGQATGSFEAELMGRELSARRSEIMHALDSMAGLLTHGQQIALQKELALIDDATRRYQIGSQNDQFMADLGLKADDRASYWDALRSGLLDG